MLSCQRVCAARNCSSTAADLRPRCDIVTPAAAAHARISDAAGSAAPRPFVWRRPRIDGRVPHVKSGGCRALATNSANDLLSASAFLACRSIS
eukprot:TRINITY_DN26110_c0_g1_i1.p4 TRINITY_DN26110_c0_g1~~TRINITY_DN26110_c0_g1_i1.p4  ORF type:complete len:93 (-),score=1.21 TRINITY_DN26110_c0_g1_i1:20-298(-)